jgi:S-(hydroxymethyl)glutathione dehydrogenase / alcohol dehydrogenase
MRAAVLRTAPGELQIEDVAVDKPGGREVLIRTAATGVCHSDLLYAEGKFRTRLPAVLGHEAAGVVEAVGEDVTYVAPGDHVVTCLSIFCGTCEYCLSGHPNLCVNTGHARSLRRSKSEPPRLSAGDEAIWQFQDLSAFAEQMLVHENAVVRVTKDLPLDRAALIGCAVTTGLGAVFHTAAVKPGSTVAVIGCGGVGLNAVQGARLAGAGRIVAVDRIKAKLELARDFGATDVVDASAGDPVQQVLELTSGGVHYSFEAIGLAPTTAQAFGMLRAGGVATVIGMIPPGTTVELPGVDFMFEKQIRGSLMGSNRFRIDIPGYVDLYLQNRLKLDELVSARISLDEVSKGLEELHTGKVARSVVLFD